MYKLSEKSAAIVERISESGVIKTVRYLDSIEQEDTEPAIFPAAFLAVENIDGTNRSSTFPAGPLSWCVIVKGKSHEGSHLLLAVDSVLDLLDGFFPEGSQGDCLKIGLVEFFGREQGAVSYKITFKQNVYGRSRSERD